ncbi:MAG: ABC transporter permease, partial [Acidobacteria bacterium]|nr:ABC transporter permease [Acidobacteriota bacterium]
MSRVRAFYKRLAGVLGRPGAVEDFDRELESHLQLHIDESVRAGMTLDEARRKAIRKLGGLEKTKQAYLDRLTLPSFESLLQDARFALRLFTRKPAQVAVIILVLALGIGGNAAVFSMVNAVLMRPLPYRDSHRLVVVWQSSDQHRNTGEWFDTYREFEEWQNNSRSFEKLAALSWATSDTPLVWRGRAQNVLAIPATVDFFSMLDVSAAMGRTFERQDLAQDCTLVLSHNFWQTRLGAPHDVVGQTLALNQRDCRVVGVMPRDFSFYPVQTALWTLVTPNSPFAKDAWRSQTGVFGRLKSGINRGSAESELEILERNILREAPRNLVLPQAVPVVLDLQSEFTWLAGRNLRTALLLLLSAVFLVLMIACVNVANLLLAQGANREKEFAVRASLGAGRKRLIRQLLLESTLLSLAGACLGIGLAVAVIRIFDAKNPIELPPGNSVELNWQVLAFAATLTLLSAVLFGLVPAWKASRLDVHRALKAGSRNPHPLTKFSGAQSFVIACEIALSLILLTGAGLLMQSLERLAHAPLGFRTDHLLVGSLRLLAKNYSDPAQRIQFFDQLRDQLAAIPGVKGVSFGSTLYLTGSNVLAVQGRTFERATAQHNVASETIDDHFLEVMGIPLLRGRTFDTRDRPTTPSVALINQALADQYFPNEDPIGHAIKLGLPEDPRPWMSIVGVVGNVKTTTVFQEMGYVVAPAVYRPLVEEPPLSMSLFVRTERKPEGLANAVEQRPLLLANDVTLANLKTMEESVSELQAQPRFRTLMLSGFAALALVLASIGIYGVLSQSVAYRTREIAVRMSLGATQLAVIRLILTKVLSTVLLGLVVGLGCASLLVRIFAGLLYQVRAENPLI